MNAIVKAYTLSECMEAMASYANTYESSGGKNLIFCEDRLTLIAERALIKGTGGTFSSAVSTFARFLKTDGQAITKQGSVMAVGEVMTRLQREEKLQCFKTVAGIGNNAKSIYETLAQFSASEITPDVLKESLGHLPEDMLKKKVQDLALIFEGYNEFLREGGFVDESHYLSLLPKRIREDGSLKGYNVFFVGYSSFTAQAKEIIRAALDTADNVIGVFCAGEEELYANRAATAFERVCKEYGKLHVLDFGTPLMGEAETLRKGLFNPVRSGAPKYTEKVSIFEAGDKTAECEYVATKIRREMAEKDLHFRDFAVLTPDTASYSLPLKKAFSEYGIPFFIDEKKSLKNHPLSRFLLDAFRVVRENFSALSVQSLCSNFFFGDGDSYRNYLLKYANYRGGARKEIKTDKNVAEQYDIAYLNECKEKLERATKNIKTEGHGRVYCDAIEQILVDFDVENRLKELQEEIDDVAQKGFLAQIYRALEGVLAEARLLTRDKKLKVAEFEAILRDGLDATQISLIPLKSDAVFVGDITDSRIEKVNVLFAMGMTDAVPRSAGDTAIISDKEIKRLEDVQAYLEPTVAEVNLRSRESVCLNLCTFLDKLYLSYPLAADGSEPSLSEIFRDVDALFCEEGGGKLLRRKKFSMEDLVYKCSAVAPLLRQYLLEKKAYELGKTNSSVLQSTLFSALDKLSVTEKDDYLEERGGQVSIERGKELFFRGDKISPTALEGYFSCPFKHFAERGLKLKEREETAVLAVDSGNFIHELLEKTLVETENVSSEEQMRIYARQAGEEILKKPVYSMQKDTESGKFFAEKLLGEGVEVAVAAYRQLRNSSFRIENLEQNVDGEFFHGKVDRVDGTACSEEEKAQGKKEYVRVVDYKTGRIDDSAGAYYTGRKLQMQLYMTEVMGERVPAGVFYFPAALDYASVEDGRFRMKGFMNGSEEALRCGDKNIQQKEKSEYFPAALKNHGSVKRVMDEGTFRDFIDYSTLVAGQGYAELKEGYIEATPYHKSCEYCKYGGMCGYCKDVAEDRKEEKIEPQEIAKIVQKTRSGEE